MLAGRPCISLERLLPLLLLLAPVAVVSAVAAAAATRANAADAAAAAGAAAAADEVSAARPHVVFVLGDDVGFGDIGYVDPAVISPTIDALAMGGVRFGRAYSYCWCAPSRSALMTGRLPPNNGVYSGASGAYFALSAEYRILPQMLAKADYVSHAVGKVSAAAAVLVSSDVHALRSSLTPPRRFPAPRWQPFRSGISGRTPRSSCQRTVGLPRFLATSTAGKTTSGTTMARGERRIGACQASPLASASSIAICGTQRQPMALRMTPRTTLGTRHSSSQRRQWLSSAPTQRAPSHCRSSSSSLFKRRIRRWKCRRSSSGSTRGTSPAR